MPSPRHTTNRNIGTIHVTGMPSSRSKSRKVSPSVQTKLITIVTIERSGVRYDFITKNSKRNIRTTTPTSIHTNSEVVVCEVTKSDTALPVTQELVTTSL